MHRKIVPDIVCDQTLASRPPGATVHEAARTMSERHIGAVSIAAEGRLRGIFTGRDAPHPHRRARPEARRNGAMRSSSTPVTGPVEAGA